MPSAGCQAVRLPIPGAAVGHTLPIKSDDNIGVVSHIWRRPDLNLLSFLPPDPNGPSDHGKSQWSETLTNNSTLLMRRYTTPVTIAAPMPTAKA